MWGRTNVGAKIRRCEDAHAQITIDLANDFDGIVQGKVGVLLGSQYAEPGRNSGARPTYPVQVQVDGSAGVDGGLLTAQLRHLAEDAHSLVSELLEVACSDTGSLFGHGGCVFSFWSGGETGLVDARQKEERFDASTSRASARDMVFQQPDGQCRWMLRINDVKQNVEMVGPGLCCCCLRA